MDKTTYDIRLDQWTKLVQSCTSSGLSKKEWCCQNNIKQKTYYYWQRRVRKQALALQETRVPSDTSLTEITFDGHDSGCASGSAEHHTFRPDIVIRSASLTIEISNSASSSLLAAVGKVIAYAE